MVSCRFSFELGLALWFRVRLRVKVATIVRQKEVMMTGQRKTKTTEDKENDK